MQGDIDRLNREIAALGAVNLAALEELAAARERMIEGEVIDVTPKQLDN